MSDHSGSMSRRGFLCGSAAVASGIAGIGPAATRPVPAGEGAVPEILAEAARLGPLETVIVARKGEVVAERAYDGHSLTAPTNIKSASKAVLSALVGMAIDRGLLEGV